MAGLARVAAAAWLAIIVVAMALAAFAPMALERLASHGPGCPFLLMFHLDCPFCGMTRASLALARGEFNLALVYHPLAPLVLVGIITLLSIVAIGRTNWLLRGRRPLALLVAIGVVWILRLVLG